MKNIVLLSTSEQQSQETDGQQQKNAEKKMITRKEAHVLCSIDICRVMREIGRGRKKKKEGKEGGRGTEGKREREESKSQR